MYPKSPWIASVAWIKIDGFPVELKVAAILLAIFALLPTPDIINLPFDLYIKSTASVKSLVNWLDNWEIDSFSTSITFFAIFRIF